jgi:hypothetical protein
MDSSLFGFLSHETEDGGKYGLDSTFYGVEYLFHELENGGQIDICTSRWSTLDTFLECSTFAEEFDFENQDCKSREGTVLS